MLGLEEVGEEPQVTPDELDLLQAVLAGRLHSLLPSVRQSPQMIQASTTHHHVPRPSTKNLSTSPRNQEPADLEVQAAGQPESTGNGGLATETEGRAAVSPPSPASCPLSCASLLLPARTGAC